MHKITFNKKTDKIAIIAPSSGCVNAKERLQKGVELLESHGFACQYDDDILSGHASLEYFASSQEQRVKELKDALLDPSVKIIWAFRGGYGASDVAFDFIDFDPLLVKPKIIIGFSDITVLLSLFSQVFKMPAIHGSVINSLLDKQPEMLESIISVLSGNDMSFHLEPLNNYAKANKVEVSGRMVGGNLSIICHMIGSKLEAKTSGKIVFLEDVNEKGYHVHRYLVQMKNAGLFEKAKGLVLGDFSDSDDKLVDSLEHFCNNYLHIPAFRAEGIGHARVNYPVIIGGRASIKKNQLNIKSPFELIC